MSRRAHRARHRQSKIRRPREAYVDVVTMIPAQTMANDQGGKLCVLPMGSLFETAQMIAFELKTLTLRPCFS